jgi:hypothetical protein
MSIPDALGWPPNAKLMSTRPIDRLWGTFQIWRTAF